MARLGLELPSRLVEIEFLITERQGNPPLREHFTPHAQDTDVKRAGRLDIRNGEYNVIQALDPHDLSPVPDTRAAADPSGASLPWRTKSGGWHDRLPDRPPFAAVFFGILPDF
ncbi:MAG: hypothetical protein Kow0032_23310 [Methyloligellaceae bacterium]